MKKKTTIMNLNGALHKAVIVGIFTFNMKLFKCFKILKMLLNYKMCYKLRDINFTKNKEPEFFLKISRLVWKLIIVTSRSKLLLIELISFFSSKNNMPH